MAGATSKSCQGKSLPPPSPGFGNGRVVGVVAPSLGVTGGRVVNWGAPSPVVSGGRVAGMELTTILVGSGSAHVGKLEPLMGRSTPSRKVLLAKHGRTTPLCGTLGISSLVFQHG